MERRARRVAEDAEIMLALAGHRFQRHGVDRADRLPVVQAVLENPLPVADHLDAILGAQQHSAPGHFEQKAVAAGHGVEQGLQLEVLDQGRPIGRQVAGPLELEVTTARQPNVAQLEVARAVHQPALHDRMRSRRRP
jgi:hypothetical protein